MAIYKEDLADIELTSGSIHRTFLNHSIGKGDIKENRFGVRLFRNGQAENIGSGYSCAGYFTKADGTVVTLSSSNAGVSGNTAWVTLTEACYTVEGKFTLAIKVTGGGVTTTMRIVDGMVDNTGAS